MTQIRNSRSSSIKQTRRLRRNGDLYFKSGKDACISSKLWDIGQRVLQISQEKSLTRSFKCKATLKWPKTASFHLLFTKKKRPKRCHFERYYGSSPSPGCAKQGKKKIFSSSVLTDFPSQKDADSSLKRHRHNPHFPRVGRAVEGRQHSGRPSYVPPLFLPIKTREEKKKDDEKERRQKRER